MFYHAITGYMFYRACHRLRAFPRLSLVKSFPALAASFCFQFCLVGHIVSSYDCFDESHYKASSKAGFSTHSCSLDRSSWVGFVCSICALLVLSWQVKKNISAEFPWTGSAQLLRRTHRSWIKTKHDKREKLVLRTLIIESTSNTYIYISYYSTNGHDAHVWSTSPRYLSPVHDGYPAIYV